MKKLLWLLPICLGAMILSGCNGVPAQQAPTPSPSQEAQQESQEAVHRHSFGDWTALEQETCEQDGLYERTCACGYREEKSVSAKGHRWSEADCENPSVCQTCKEQKGSALDHSLENGVCTRCKQSFRTKQDVQQILNIVHVGIYRIDSAGGVSVDVGWENKSEKTVKYIYFTVCPYNAVGDPISCEIRGRTNVTLEQTGPVEPGARAYDINKYGHYVSGDYIWDNVWYNDTAKSIKLFKVQITYTDGSEVILEGTELEWVYGEMSLSTNAVKVDMDVISYTVHGTDGALNLQFALIGDEGYQIKKMGSVHVKMTELVLDSSFNVVEAGVMYEADVALSDECYSISYSNEAILAVYPGFAKKGQTSFRVELTFTFEDAQETLTHSVMCIARVI